MSSTNKEVHDVVRILQKCLNANERPTAAQLVDELESLEEK